MSDEQKPIGATGGIVDPDKLGKYTFLDRPEVVVPLSESDRTVVEKINKVISEHMKRLRPTVPICSWKWDKMTSTEQVGFRRCNCYHDCRDMRAERVAARDASILRSRERKQKVAELFQLIRSIFKR